MMMKVGTRLALSCAVLAIAMWTADAAVQYVSILDGASEATPVVSENYGVAICTYDTTTMTLSFDLGHSVTDPDELHLHRGMPGKNGAKLRVLAAGAAAASPIVGSTVLDAEEEGLLYRGRLYFNLHSDTFPGGELRGQIGGFSNDNVFGVVGNPNQEVPPAAGNSRAHSAWVYDPATASLNYWVVHNIGSGNAIHLHYGAAGVNGPGVDKKILCADVIDCASPFVGSVPLDGNSPTIADIRAGLSYINVHIDAAGIARGQLETEAPIATDSPVPAWTHYAYLDGDQEVPPVGSGNSGVAALRLSSLYLEYHIEHSVADATGVHIHWGAQGTTSSFPFKAVLCTTDDGTKTYPDACQSPLIGRIDISPDFINATAGLLADQLYINIHSTTFSGGDIRGQILRRGPVLVAVADGGQEEVDVATNHNSISLLTLDPNGNNPNLLGYTVLHDFAASEVTGIHIHYASGGRSELPISAPRTEGTVTITTAQADDIAAGDGWVNFHTTSFPDGEIRGDTVALDWQPVDFVTWLDGASEAEPVASGDIGVAVSTLDASSRVFAFAIHHTLSDATAVHLHTGLPGKDGAKLADLTLTAAESVSPVVGAIPFTSEMEYALSVGQLYFNIHSTAHSKGALRGTLATFSGRNTVFSALCSSAMEVPPSMITGASCSAVFHYNAASNSMDYWVVYEAPTTISAIHLHRGAYNVNGVGTEKYVLCDNAGASPCPAAPLPLTGSIALDALPAISDIINEYAYLNLHNPAGVVRATLTAQVNPGVEGIRPERVMNFAAVMSGDQEVPAVEGNDGERGLALFEYLSSTKTLYYHIQHNVEAATGVHIHMGPAGSNAVDGALKIVLGSNADGVVDGATSPLTGSIVFEDELAEGASAIMNAELYVNIHSAAHPDGAVRGQIFSKEAAFTSEAAGTYAEPPVSTDNLGAGRYQLDSDGNLDYLIFHTFDLTEVTGVHVHFPSDMSKAELEPLDSPLEGTVALSASQAQDVKDGVAYLNIHTEAYSGGEVRGTVMAFDQLLPGDDGIFGSDDDDGSWKWKTGLVFGILALCFIIVGIVLCIKFCKCEDCGAKGFFRRNCGCCPCCGPSRY